MLLVCLGSSDTLETLGNTFDGSLSWLWSVGVQIDMENGEWKAGGNGKETPLIFCRVGIPRIHGGEDQDLISKAEFSMQP